MEVVGSIKIVAEKISNIKGYRVLNKKTIKGNGYLYKVRSKKTNVEFDVSDSIYYGYSGHIVDRAIFYIKDTYKESWYMQIAKNVGIDYKIIKIDSDTIDFDVKRFSSFEEFCKDIYNYKYQIADGDLYKIIKDKRFRFQNVDVFFRLVVGIINQYMNFKILKKR